jgi:hypothetical protein
MVEMGDSHVVVTLLYAPTRTPNSDAHAELRRARRTRIKRDRRHRKGLSEEYRTSCERRGSVRLVYDVDLSSTVNRETVRA